MMAHFSSESQFVSTRGSTVDRSDVQLLKILRNDRPLSFRDVLSLWECDESFVVYFSELLNRSTFAAYRWETPPVTRENLDRVFEFVLINSPALDRAPDLNSFDSHFRAGIRNVVFPNIRGDAILVVPCPETSWQKQTYVHFGAFLRSAPKETILDFFANISKAMNERISDQPVWLSTAGMGVAWLHVRLDSRPKYYGYVPYRSESI